MHSLLARIKASPALVRAVPFVVFVALTAFQGQFGETSRYWVYFAKTLAGAWLLWSLRGAIREMKWAFSWEAMVVGVAVFVLWVGLDGHYSNQHALLIEFGLSKPSPEPLPQWNPLLQFSGNVALAWLFIAVRMLGVSLVVPPLEEVFYRSFLYRWIVKPEFESVPLGRFAVKPFALTALLFGFAHNEWLAGILCAFAYQGLVCRKKRLGDAMTAHAITNLLLGGWVVWKGAWHFW